MPEDSKKNQNKSKHEAKEQRKPRQSRHAADKSEKKNEKRTEEPRVPAQTKPVYNDPGPEFYKSLKRETDEILKITEEANDKYKKKEIKSNWSKYEMPIESYDEIEEQEHIGADYEKLIEAPLSIGGHFQFKHEKSWDVDTAPSLYDKYFEINMENLATAINTIPFFERNDIEIDVFSEIDMLNMNNRSVRYKRKYFNDKSYTTAEIEASEKITNIMRDRKESEDKDDGEIADIILETGNTPLSDKESSIEAEKAKTENKTSQPKVIDKEIKEDVTKLEKSIHSMKIDEKLDNIDDLLLGNTKTEETVVHVKDEKQAGSSSQKNNQKSVEKDSKPVLESPEDLEKWLDDFLDG